MGFHIGGRRACTGAAAAALLDLHRGFSVFSLWTAALSCRCLTSSTTWSPRRTSSAPATGTATCSACRRAGTPASTFPSTGCTSTQRTWCTSAKARANGQALYQLFMNDPNGVKVELNFDASEAEGMVREATAEGLLPRS